MTSEDGSRSRESRFRLSRLDRRWALRVLAVGLVSFLLGYAVTALFFFPASKRPPVVAVPDLREMEEEAAERRLDAAGLDLEVGDSLPNPRVPAGRILSQSPLPGQEVVPGSPVRVVLSAGPERRPVPVVSSMTGEQATRLLEASGFRVRVEEVEDLRTAGRVVGIEPGPGTEVEIPTTVTLRVSSGPPLVAVPDLTGLREPEAAAALESAGLLLGEVEFRFAGLTAEELVIGQSPAPGASVPQGTVVRIRVATDRLPGTIIR